MLIKLETKSARVKGLAFHPTKRWLLASLHNGVIQLWDLDAKTMTDKFEGHQGPVRGIDFHNHQPLFVSGGDDKKINVWNYKKRRCLFTLDAHEDYVRSTYFHHEHPWILSSSDDQSIRIWNWQSRSRIAVLTGHTHYIMCAQFHPASELILSASIDQTLRLWDITGLKMKNSSSTKEETSGGLPEILTKTEYSVESKEGHLSEINWCAFHPDSNKQLCLSTADDNYIKVWKIDSRNGLREVDTLRGHYNNVSCATFHPRKDMILSASEDRSIKVWDLEKRTALCTHRKEVDRFWTIAAHPKENLFAAGHDTGVMLFKIEKERPAFTVFKDVILFIKGKQLCKYNMRTHEKKFLITLKPKIELTHHYHKIHCYNFDEIQSAANPTNQVLVSVRSTNAEKSIYLYRITPTNYGEAPEPIKSPGLTAIFIGPNRYAVLDKSKRVIFKVNNEERKGKTTLNADEIFEAGTGRLFVKSKIKDVATISLWDVERACAVNSIQVDAKNVVISDDKNYVACLCSNRIVICDGSLNVLSTVVELGKIKSAAWGEGGVLIYSTPTHVKYSLTDGDTTTIVAVPGTLYIMAVRNDRVFCIDRNNEIKQIPVDAREFKFKQAVVKNDRTGILAALRQLGTLTHAEISFLVEKGHPGLALKFVKDHKTRFPLALQAFDIDEALDSANHLKDKKCWEQLSKAALKLGHFEATEKAYHELKKPYKLAMLYLVSGQREKMIQARSLARELGESSTEFLISLLVKDFEECTKIIRRLGHPNLAYTCAVNHGLYDLAAEISQELTDKQLLHLPPLEDARTNSSWMHATIPDIGNSDVLQNWPLLRDEQAEDFETALTFDTPDEPDDEDKGEWDDDELKSDDDSKGSGSGEAASELADADEDGWGADEPSADELRDDDDEDDEEDRIKAKPVASLSREKPQDIQSGQALTSKWTKMSDLALHHVLAGSYKTAYGFLQSQVGVVDVGPLKDIFQDLLLQSKVAYQSLPLYPTTFIHPRSNEYRDEVPLPAGGYSIEDLEKRLNESYTLFLGGKFDKAIDSFRTTLLSCLFLQIYSGELSTSKEKIADREKKANEIIKDSRKYILSLQLWIERKNISGQEFEDDKRACELLAYFADLRLNPKHEGRILERAFDVFLKTPKEFHKTRAAQFVATRYLDRLSPKDLNSTDPKKMKMIQRAEKVKSSFDAEEDQKLRLDFDRQNPYELCAATFKPIYKGNPLVSCPLCQAKYKPEHSGQTCKVCQVSQIGKTCSGIRFKLANFDDIDD